jgi:hypothetical protein
MRAFKIVRPRRLLVRCLAAMTVLAGVLVSAGPAAADHAGWAIVLSPSPGSSDSSLHGVSCVGAKRCIAVGWARTDPGAFSEALVESSNGGAWSIVPTPVPPAPPEAGPTEAQLYGVSCASGKFCMAVGWQRYGYRSPHCCGKTLTEAWNGSKWTFVPSPNSENNESLAGVSCVSSRFCVAVGTVYGTFEGPGRTVVESWNGTEWSLVPSPSPAIGDGLQGVSCVSARFCVAVGEEVREPYPWPALVESWNGSEWSVVPNPSTGSLHGVSCVRAKRCVAVGGGASGTLAESWDGSAWSILESPNPEGSGIPYLTGVSCVSAGSCVAVGNDSTWKEGEERSSQTLVESSKGSKWSIVPSANGGALSHLDGVSCLSPSCIAVGNNGVNPQEQSSQTLVESGGI